MTKLRRLINWVELNVSFDLDPKETTALYKEMQTANLTYKKIHDLAKQGKAYVVE